MRFRSSRQGATGPRFRPRGSGASLERPGFVAASFGVSLLVVAGIGVSIIAAVDDDGAGDANARAHPQTSSQTSAATAVPDPVSAQAAAIVSPSTCGLPEIALDSAADPSGWKLALAPETSWREVDVNLAPSGQGAGPAAVHGDGFAYCFQRSPEGALLTAANFLVQSNTPGLRAPVLDYTLAPGVHRQPLLVDAGAAAGAVRLQIVGYRMLAFDGESARVDVAQRVTVDGATNVIAAVVDLQWVDGDWRIPTDDPHPVRMQALSDVGGYTRWGA